MESYPLTKLSDNGLLQLCFVGDTMVTWFRYVVIQALTEWKSSDKNCFDAFLLTFEKEAESTSLLDSMHTRVQMFLCGYC